MITPFMNAQPFIAAAIESILAQSCSGCEMLLIDSGATPAPLLRPSRSRGRCPDSE